MDEAELVRRLDELESREAIRELITAYGIANDDHDVPRLADLFTEDAEFSAPNSNMVANGRAAIEAMYINTFKTRGPSFHWTHDVTITMSKTDPDHATGLVLSHAETCPNGVASIAAMRYNDEYRRAADGIWRFAKREILFLYYAPVSEFNNVLNQTDRVYRGNDKFPADIPENLETWQSFAKQYGEDK